jgi:hypothetical protein
MLFINNNHKFDNMSRRSVARTCFPSSGASRAGGSKASGFGRSGDLWTRGSELPVISPRPSPKGLSENRQRSADNAFPRGNLSGLCSISLPGMGERVARILAVCQLLSAIRLQGSEGQIVSNFALGISVHLPPFVGYPQSVRRNRFPPENFTRPVKFPVPCTSRVYAGVEVPMPTLTAAPPNPPSTSAVLSPTWRRY